MLYEKIIEIIVHLLSELKNNKQLGEIDMENLSRMGYTQNEINTAFSWVYSKIYSGEKVFSNKKESKSHRFLNKVEENVIEPDAYGYLIQLKELRLIDDMDIESILDKIMISASKVSLGDIKTIMAAYLSDLNHMTDSNSRIMLNANDIVN